MPRRLRVFNDPEVTSFLIKVPIWESYLIVQLLDPAEALKVISLWL
jgi:hypothetical protein